MRIQVTPKIELLKKLLVQGYSGTPKSTWNHQEAPAIKKCVAALGIVGNKTQRATPVFITVRHRCRLTNVCPHVAVDHGDCRKQGHWIIPVDARGVYPWILPVDARLMLVFN